MDPVVVTRAARIAVARWWRRQPDVWAVLKKYTGSISYVAGPPSTRGHLEMSKVTFDKLPSRYLDSFAYVTIRADPTIPEGEIRVYQEGRRSVTFNVCRDSIVGFADRFRATKPTPTGRK